MARGRPRRKSLRNVSNCDVCERRGPGCPCVCVSAVTDPRAAHYWTFRIYLNLARENRRMATQCSARGGEARPAAEGGAIPIRATLLSLTHVHAHVSADSAHTWQ